MCLLMMPHWYCGNYMYTWNEVSLLTRVTERSAAKP